MRSALECRVLRGFYWEWVVERCTHPLSVWPAVPVAADARDLPGVQR